MPEWAKEKLAAVKEKIAASHDNSKKGRDDAR